MGCICKETVMKYSKLILCLIIILVYQLILFCVFGAVCFGIGSVLVHSYDFVFDIKPPLALETFVSILLMRFCGFLHVELLLCELPLERRRQKSFIIIIVVGTNVVYWLLFVLAIYGVMNQYIMLHEVPVRKEFGSPEENLDVAIYIVCMYYIIFTTSKVFRKYILVYTSNLEKPLCRSLYGFVSMLLLQALLTAIYFLPLLGLKILCMINDITIRYEFLILMISAVILGVGSGLVEQIWPRKTIQAPHFFYENNLLGRFLAFDIFLWPWVNYFFFRRKDYSSLNSKNSDWFIFSAHTSISVMHGVKIIMFSLWKHSNFGVLFGWDFNDWNRSRNLAFLSVTDRTRQVPNNSGFIAASLKNSNAALNASISKEGASTISIESDISDINRLNNTSETTECFREQRLKNMSGITTGLSFVDFIGWIRFLPQSLQSYIARLNKLIEHMIMNMLLVDSDVTTTITTDIEKSLPSIAFEMALLESSPLQSKKIVSCRNTTTDPLICIELTEAKTECSIPVSEEIIQPQHYSSQIDDEGSSLGNRLNDSNNNNIVVYDKFLKSCLSSSNISTKEYTFKLSKPFTKLRSYVLTLTQMIPNSRAVTEL